MRKDVLEVIGSAAYQPDTESIWWSSSSEPIKATLIASPIRPDDVVVCVGESIRAGWLSTVPSWTPLGVSSAWLAEHMTTLHSTSWTNKRNNLRWYRTNKKLWSGKMFFTSHLNLLPWHNCRFTRRRDRNELWGLGSRLTTWEAVAIYTATQTSCNDTDVDHPSYSRSFPQYDPRETIDSHHSIAGKCLKCTNWYTFYFCYHGSILIWDKEVAYSNRVALPACDNWSRTWRRSTFSWNAGRNSHPKISKISEKYHPAISHWYHSMKTLTVECLLCFFKIE